MGLLRTLLIILAVYYGVKLLTRLLAPLMVKYMSKKMTERFGQQPYRRGYGQPTERPKEGETVIDKIPNTPQRNESKVGEYIDYEEIE